MAEMTHAEKIQRHFDIIGKPNPFKAVHSAQARAGERKGGLGSNKGAARYESTSAEDRAKANSDGKFGYFDEVNKRYVPAFIDAMDGGGRDNRGDTFEGGPLSQILNNVGIKPYGSQRERAYVSPTTSPIQQAVSGAIPRPRVRPEQSMQFGDQPAGSMPSMSFGQQPAGSMPAATPNPFTGPTYDMPAAPTMPMQFGQQPAGSMPVDRNVFTSDVFRAPPPSMQFGGQPAGSMPAEASSSSMREYPEKLLNLYSREFLDQLDENALEYLFKLQ